jgi:cytochrome P450
MTVVPPHVDPAVVREFDYHTDPAFLADPYAAFDRVRDLRAFYSTAHGGYWVLTRCEDIRQAFQQPEIFSSREFAIPTGVYPRVLRPLALDPPDHGTYRQLLAPLFAPPSVARREPALRAVCESLVDAFAADGQADLLERLARPFPTTVFVALAGLPAESAETFEEWNHALLHGYDDPEARRTAAKNIIGALDDLIRIRLAEGPDDREDLLAVLLRAEIDGRPLCHDELLDYAFLLFIAGLDTVTAVMGFSLHRLATDSGLRDRLAGDRTVVPDAVEELLRAHAIVNPARVVTRPTTFAGVDMQPGDRVLLATPLATRDPQEFERADEIVIDREGNRHLAFGAGPHRCLGSHLARLELRIAIETVLDRLSGFRLEPGASVTIHGGGVLGIDRLPVVWEAAG